MRFPIALIAASLVSGCALYPVAREIKSSDLIAKGKDSPLIAPDVTDTRHMVAGVRAVLAEDVQKRQTTEIVVSEIGYYGAMLAVAGSIEDSIAARKFGGGLAALASAFTGRYKTSEQKLAFGKALRRVDCVGRAIGPINPSVRELFEDKPENAELIVQYSNIPRQTALTLDTIRVQLQTELAGITLGTQSPEQMAEAFKKWLEAKKKAEDTGKGSAEDAKNKVDSALTANQSSLVATGAAGALACSRATSAGEVACGLLDFKAQTPAQQYDAIRQFQIAVASYEATLATCIAEPQ